MLQIKEQNNAMSNISQISCDNKHLSVINIQMFQMSWVQFLTAVANALAKALQLTEMGGQMKRPVNTEIPCRNRQWSLQSFIE